MPNRTTIAYADYSSNPIRDVYLDERELQRMITFRPTPDGCRHRGKYAHLSTLRSGESSVPRQARPDASASTQPWTIRLVQVPVCLFKNGRSRPAVFVCVDGEWVPDEWLDRLFAVFALRPDVDWLLLTKRQERMRAYLSEYECEERVADAVWQHPHLSPEMTIAIGRGRLSCLWPLANVWLGTSVEDQATADQRIPQLLATPAAVRFLIYEPALGPVSLEPWLSWPSGGSVHEPVLSWVLAGGESGPGARPCDLAWLRSVVAQCQEANVPVFVTQLGARPGYPMWDPATRKGGIDEALAVGQPLGWRFSSRDGSSWQRLENGHRVGHYIGLRDRKGGSPEEWPADLRVREMPGGSTPAPAPGPAHAAP